MDDYEELKLLWKCKKIVGGGQVRPGIGGVEGCGLVHRRGLFGSNVRGTPFGK